MQVAKLHMVLNDSVELIKLSRKGIQFTLFQDIVNASPFSIKQWSKFLLITERTIQRYKKEQKAFETIQSERIIAIARLQKKGEEVLGSKTNFDQWMNSVIIAIGGIKPVELLDSSFGIDLLMDELVRIEHGVLA